MKILVTGGAGFIGSHVVDLLIEKGHDVAIVDNLSTGKEENIHPKANFFEVDITERRALEEAFRFVLPEVVIHNAAQIDVQKSLQDPMFDSAVNVLGTLQVLELCIAYKVKKIIYPSTAAAYGAPISLPISEDHPVAPQSFYGISKHTPEHFMKVYRELHGLEYTVLRYANVYGPRQDAKGEGGVVSIFTDRLYEELDCYIFGDGGHTRDFIYVKDIAAANEKALYAGDGEILNISTCTRLTLTELYDTTAKLFECTKAPIYTEERKGDIRHSSLDNTKAKSLLGWEAKFSLEEGLRETVQWRKGVL